ncbi:SapC family protein (plasmid) [Caulobacter sp. ErkDOM-YI]|uniref:SapC family protein n=1 Tax=unclassified Caulobacter TaxID=2648921 RepID=UPI003AF98403
MFEALDPQRHGDLHLRSDFDMSSVENRGHARLGFSEMVNAAADYPIIFMKDGTSGAFHLCALFGFDRNRSLYALAQSWHANWLPMDITRGPLALIKTEGDWVVGANTADPRLSKTGGQALYNPERLPSAWLVNATSRLLAHGEDLAAADVFTENLAKAGLIAPLKVELSLSDGQVREITGLYTINKPAVQKLEVSLAIELLRNGALEGAFRMLGTQGQFSRLRHLFNAHSGPKILSMSLDVGI